jgi:hypothetical protein
MKARPTNSIHARITLDQLSLLRSLLAEDPKLVNAVDVVHIPIKSR